MGYVAPSFDPWPWNYHTHDISWDLRVDNTSDLNSASASSATATAAPTAYNIYHMPIPPRLLSAAVSKVPPLRRSRRRRPTTEHGAAARDMWFGIMTKNVGARQHRDFCELVTCTLRTFPRYREKMARVTLCDTSQKPFYVPVNVLLILRNIIPTIISILANSNRLLLSFLHRTLASVSLRPPQYPRQTRRRRRRRSGSVGSAWMKKWSDGPIFRARGQMASEMRHGDRCLCKCIP